MKTVKRGDIRKVPHVLGPGFHRLLGMSEGERVEVEGKLKVMKVEKFVIGYSTGWSLEGYEPLPAEPEAVVVFKLPWWRRLFCRVPAARLLPPRE